MATNDLSSKETIVQNYMKELAKSQFPNVDMSDHGAFMEMFGVPHVKLMQPLLDYADRIKLTQSLNNAELMTEAEMDEYAANAHFMYRKTGEYATGYVNISFDDVPANGVIQIPAGTEANSKQGYGFRSLETEIFNEEELANYYDTDTFRYVIPVFFEAQNPGAAYNVAENDINEIVTPLANLIDVTNPIAFKGGKDKETNAEFKARIEETAETPNVGVERGWKKFAREFDAVEDVIVAGYGHPLMKRDIVGLAPKGRFSSQVSREIHWGGKTDLHLRGKDLAEYVETSLLKRNEEGDLVMPLEKHPTYDVMEIQFSSPRYTDPDLDPTFFIVKDFLLMKKEERETMGTLFEESWVVIKDDRLEEDDTVTVRYRYNQLLESMQNALYEEDNRPPASDILLKESKKKFIHSSIIVRLDTVVGLKETDKSTIRQRLYNYINQLPTGAELQFSDLTEPIYEHDTDSIETKVDYISLPSQFVVTDYDNKFLYYCLNKNKRDFIDKIMQESVYFNQWIPYYMDNVTLYDFFDVMHTLTYQNVEKDAWKSLSYKNHDWSKKTYFINMAKRMLAYVNSIQRLSPAKWNTAENDYFELGYLQIFEDVPYHPTELEEWVNLFENIANPGETEYKDDNLLHLTVYCSVMLYIMTADNIGGMEVTDLFDWLIDLTKGTPIDYQVHH